MVNNFISKEQVEAEKKKAKSHHRTKSQRQILDSDSDNTEASHDASGNDGVDSSPLSIRKGGMKEPNFESSDDEDNDLPASSNIGTGSYIGDDDSFAEGVSDRNVASMENRSSDEEDSSPPHRQR